MEVLIVVVSPHLLVSASLSSPPSISPQHSLLRGRCSLHRADICLRPVVVNLSKDTHSFLLYNCYIPNLVVYNFIQFNPFSTLCIPYIPWQSRLSPPQRFRPAQRHLMPLLIQIWQCTGYVTIVRLRERERGVTNGYLTLGPRRRPTAISSILPGLEH